MVVALKLERDQSLQPVFSRHETFHPRNGWLKKGFDGAKEDREIFNKEEAPIVLGVGKNMAKSIRYWCQAFKLLQEQTDPESKSKVLESTKFGDQLMRDDGWDPYLEDTGSLWLLHWKLLQNPCTAASWYFAFNFWRHAEFTQEDFLNDVSEFARQTWPNNSFADATLKNDVSCFTRMYSKDDQSKQVSEETIGSPFAELDLVSRMTGGKQFSFHTGSKPNLPNCIVAAAALEYAQTIRTTEKSISVSQLSYGTGSPGLVFKIPESSVYAALEEVAEVRKKELSLSQTAGLVQLQFTKEPLAIANNILTEYYSRDRR